MGGDLPARFVARRLDRVPTSSRLLDAAFQSLGILTDEIADSKRRQFPSGRRAEARVVWSAPNDGCSPISAWRPAGCPRNRWPTSVSTLSCFHPSGNGSGGSTGLRLEKVDRTRLTRAVSEVPGDWLYEIAWRPTAVRSCAARRGSANRLGTWLLLADSTGVAERLAASLVGRGQRCVLFRAGEEFVRVGDDEYRMQPSRAEDFQCAVAEVCGPDAPPCRGLVHLWSLDSTFAGAPGSAALAETLRLGLRQRAALGSGVGEAGADSPFVARDCAVPKPWVRRRAAWTLHRQRSGDSAASCRWNTRTCEPSSWIWTPTRRRRPLTAALAEVLDPDDEEQVAYRQGQRYAARLVRYHPPADGGSPTVRSDATYLITGGLGALGRRVARWLASQGARHVVLVGRHARGVRRSARGVRGAWPQRESTSECWTWTYRSPPRSIGCWTR